MRISDWSSDVCSSDLQISALRTQALLDLQTAVGQRDLLLREVYHRVKNNLQLVEALLLLQSRKIESGQAREAIHTTRQRIHTRSEEHTSELQSLMRISYAVFCLKKKTNTQRTI